MQKVSLTFVTLVIIELWFHSVDHSEGDVRLTDNGGSAGIVEVYTAGDWHPVCADNAWDAMAVNRLCIDLGHTSGTVETARPLLLNTVIRTNVSCTADSGHLSECLPDNLVLSSSSDCLSSTVLTVACEANSELLRHTKICIALV